MWNLSGIPAWLTASADYGVTNPRGETSVTFTVKPSTPIGKYEETIYLTGNDGIDVPLTLSVKVTGNVPDWSVNPKQFENSMNIIGTLDILGVMSDDEDDIVAAFIGEEVAQLNNNQLRLDKDGRALYKWHAGLPNVSSPYTRTVSMSYDISGRTYKWDGNGMEGIIMGDLPTGNNFVTSGPDKLTMILRDPPGTGSSAEWSTGTTTSTVTVKNDTWSDSFDGGTTFMIGLKAVTLTGTAAGALAGTLSTFQDSHDITTHAIMENEGESGETIETSVTVTQAVSTSEEPDFVGADGDVFIGQATNIIFGNARHLGFVLGNDGFEIAPRDVISTGVEFGTLFNYSQSYIVNTLFPNLEKIRQSLLTYAPEDSISKFKNTYKHPVYLTSLTPDDEHYGEEGYYHPFAPEP